MAISPMALPGRSSSDHPRPPAFGYRRSQMVRWFMDHGQTRAEHMTLDEQGRVPDFGVTREVAVGALNSGKPIMTSGCAGASGEVACNRLVTCSAWPVNFSPRFYYSPTCQAG